MEVFKADSINAIEAIPGLYISDLSIARSPDSLREHDITHVVSVIGRQQCPEVRDSGIETLHIAIEDNPLENLVIHLETTCLWINHALTPKTDESGQAREPKVLVHCLQGISRSGSVVVAYIMRSQTIGYEAALAIAQSFRSIINPNSGFASQLRLWERLGYSIYSKESSANTSLSTSARQLKPEYRAWKADKDALASKDDRVKNMFMAQSMANMAASFGKRRLQMKAQAKAQDSGQDADQPTE